MYLYEPGSGINSIPRKVIKDLSGDGVNFNVDEFCEPLSESIARVRSQCIEHSQEEKKKLKFAHVSPQKIHRIIPKINEPLTASTLNRRSV